MSGPNPRILPDSAYVNGAVLPTGYWATLDLSQYQGVRGDTGGTWAPSSILQIGGAGMWFCGPVAVSNAGATVITSAGNEVTHGDSDWIGLLGAFRSYEVSIGAMGLDRSVDTVGATTTSAPQWGWNQFADGLKQSPAGGGNYASGARLVVPLDMHQGATLYSVSVEFIVGQAHTGVPASLPMVRVFQVDLDGNVTQLATNTALGGWAGAGFVAFYPAPGSGSAWHNSGTPQPITWSADANVVIDNSRYSYFCEIVDEQGANALSGNTFLSATVSFSAIPDLRPQ